MLVTVAKEWVRFNVLSYCLFDSYFSLLSWFIGSKYNFECECFGCCCQAGCVLKASP